MSQQILVQTYVDKCFNLNSDIFEKHLFFRDPAQKLIKAEPLESNADSPKIKRATSCRPSLLMNQFVSVGRQKSLSANVAKPRDRRDSCKCFLIYYLYLSFFLFKNMKILPFLFNSLSPFQLQNVFPHLCKKDSIIKLFHGQSPHGTIKYTDTSNPQVSS